MAKLNTLISFYIARVISVEPPISFLCVVKIVVLHQHFNTPEIGGALRSYYLTQALVANGHEVVVITGGTHPSYSTARVDGVEVHYLPIAYNNNFGFYKRGTAFIRYALKALSVLSTIRNVNLIYAISTPLTVGLSAIWAKRRFKIPFVFEVGDLWPDAPIELGFIKNAMLKRSLYALEKKIYREAEAVVALSPAIRSAIEKRVSRKDIWLIPNMADVEYYKPVEKSAELTDTYGVRNKFVISYIGAVGFANGLDYFLDCARACQRSDLPIHFFLAGEGAMADHLLSSAKKLQLHNLTFVPFQNREGVRQLLNITDACMICYRPHAVLETGSPNKYFDALAAGKLIITNFGGWIKEEIERARCGISLNPRNPSDCVAKVKPFLDDSTTLATFQRNARALAASTYARNLLSQQFANLVETLKQKK